MMNILLIVNWLIDHYLFNYLIAHHRSWQTSFPHPAHITDSDSGLKELSKIIYN
jgi:hypothetical protein